LSIFVEKMRNEDKFDFDPFTGWYVLYGELLKDSLNIFIK